MNTVIRRWMNMYMTHHSMHIELPLEEPFDKLGCLNKVNGIAIETRSSDFVQASLRRFNLPHGTEPSMRSVVSKRFGVHVLVELGVVIIIVENECLHGVDRNAGFNSMRISWVDDFHGKTGRFDKIAKIISVFSEPLKRSHKSFVGNTTQLWIVRTRHVSIPLMLRVDELVQPGAGISDFAVFR
jgi:hypothetical protein